MKNNVTKTNVQKAVLKIKFEHNISEQINFDRSRRIDFDLMSKKTVDRENCHSFLFNIV